MDNKIKTLISLYALVGAGSIMMIIPISLVPFAGLACAIVGFISAYIYRWKYKTDDLYQFHCTYIIRTIWWSSFILTIGIIVFGSIIFLNGDMAPINSMMASAERGVVPTEYDIYKMQIDFVQLNKGIIMIAALIALLPYPAYLIYRTFKGVKKLL